MSNFIESPRFPDFVAAWAIGGPSFKTTVIQTYGGNEFRNAAWVQELAAYEIQNAWMSNNAVNNLTNWTAARNFFMNCMGQLYAFRFWDRKDYLDDGVGTFQMLTATTFQMYKSYAISPLTYNRIIQKPVSGTVVVAGGVSPVVDYTTGIVTVASGTPVSWTGQFDVPCRFNDDMMKMGLDESSGALYNWQQMKIIEVRNF